MQLSRFATSVIALFYHASRASCARLLSGGTIIAFNQNTEQLEVIRNGSVLIEGGQITAVLDAASSTDAPPDADVEVIDCTNQIITPGFIDTHRHGWQTVFKTLGSNTTLADYGFRFSALVGAPLFTPEDLYISQITGIYEALSSGVTTILDHAHHTWTPDLSAAGLNASIDSGARVFFAYTFQNSSAEFGIPEQITQWKELASNMSSNELTELVIAYDDFTNNPTGDYTLAVIDLIKLVWSIATEKAKSEIIIGRAMCHC